MNKKPVNTHSARGFSLVELLAVMAVVALMTTLLIPSVTGLSSTAGRRGAVNVLMNTFEQARVSALESGRRVVVVFLRKDFPDADAIMVLREPEDTTSPDWKYEQLTQWRKLPKGVLLHSPQVGDSVLSVADDSTAFDTNRLPVPTPQSTLGLKALVFNEQGAVDFPRQKQFRKLIVSEGVRGTGGTEALISSKKASAGGFEIISLAQFTGRAQLDVSTISQ